MTSPPNAAAGRRPAQVVRDKLAQYLGPFSSKTSVQMMAKQTFGIDADSLTAAQIPALLEALGPTLRTLLGKPGAERVAEQIVQELHL